MASARWESDERRGKAQSCVLGLSKGAGGWGSLRKPRSGCALGVGEITCCRGGEDESSAFGCGDEMVLQQCGKDDLLFVGAERAADFVSALDAAQ
jgi:hypothetical protein